MWKFQRKFLSLGALFINWYQYNCSSISFIKRMFELTMTHLARWNCRWLDFKEVKPIYFVKEQFNLYITCPFYFSPSFCLHSLSDNSIMIFTFHIFALVIKKKKALWNTRHNLLYWEYIKVTFKHIHGYWEYKEKLFITILVVVELKIS